ncbi:MAG: hypothetical protein ACD_77C00235G0001 [uncultured bacterium]|nr:MAG: hypothetical protein ACD_77C00235G0001 [uncultured bacterium]HBY00979.1 6-phosphogluconolactonase [Rikenellaceae bacterium]
MNPSEILTKQLIRAINLKTVHNPGSRFSLAISGGSSPLKLFGLWSGKYLDKINWNSLDLFWVDERCVSPDNPESNYGTAKKMLLDKIPLHKDHIHRIQGENNPASEANRYDGFVRSYLGNIQGYDMVILGIGGDGHTSSIFPGQDHLLKSKKIYEESVNPNTGQKRVALTSNGIFNSHIVFFYINGADKLSIVENISMNYGKLMFPAGYIMKNASDPFVFWENSLIASETITKIIDKMPNVQLIIS